MTAMTGEKNVVRTNSMLAAMEARFAWLLLVVLEADLMKAATEEMFTKLLVVVVMELMIRTGWTLLIPLLLAKNLFRPVMVTVAFTALKKLSTSSEKVMMSSTGLARIPMTVTPLLVASVNGVLKAEKLSGVTRFLGVRAMFNGTLVTMVMTTLTSSEFGMPWEVRVIAMMTETTLMTKAGEVTLFRLMSALVLVATTLVLYRLTTVTNRFKLIETVRCRIMGTVLTTVLCRLYRMSSKTMTFLRKTMSTVMR